MKKPLIAVLVASQIAMPAMAQNYSPVRGTDAGAFGGLRLRIPFGGGAREPVRAGLAFAPTTRTDYQDGHVRTRIGEGFEFGYRTGRPLSFSLAGRDFSSYRLNAVQGENDGRRRGGLSTGKVALIVGGVVVVAAAVTAIVFINALNNASD